MSFPFKNIEGICSLSAVTGGGRYRSQMERWGSIPWALESDVRLFVYQQPIIRYLRAGKKRRYTGDTLVHFWSDRRPLVVEYKLDSAFETDPSLRDYYEMIRGVLKERDLDFVILTNLEVLTADFRSKEFFVRFQNDAVSAFEGEVWDAVSAAGTLCVRDLLGRLRCDPAAQLGLVPVIWRLVATRRLFVDFGQVPSLASLVSVQPLTKAFYDSITGI